jgi:peroxiredoxin
MKLHDQWIPILVAVTLAISNTVLLYRSAGLRQTFQEHLERDASRAYKKMPELRVATLDGQMITPLAEPTSRFFLLVFLSLDDCELCLQEIRSLPLALEKFQEDECTIVAIIKGGNKQRIKSFMAQNGFAFPIYVDLDAHLWKRLGIKVTPLKVLIDHKKNIMLINSPNKDNLKQEQFRDVFGTLIEMHL